MNTLTPAQRNRRLVIGLIALLVFIIDAFLVQTGRIQALDDAIRFAVYDGRTDTLTAFWKCCTFFGEPKTIIGIALLLILLPWTRKKIGLPAAACAIPGYAIYKVEKMLFARPRPDETVWLIQEHGLSFPSGHSMNGLICYGIVIYLIRRSCPNRTLANILTVVLALLILVIGLSRPYLGVHYPSDILGGWSMGIAWLMFATVALEALNQRYLEKHRL